MASVRNPLSSEARHDIEDLEDLYEHAPCGYLSLAPGGRIDRVNATFLGWTGHTAAELLGRNFQNLLSMAARIFYETHFAPLLRLQGFFNEVALDLIAKDGTPIPVLVNAVERRDIDGKASFIRITLFNATDRRRYERELLAARNDLATVNEELRALNDELGDANHQLDKANRELRAYYETLPVGIFRTDRSGRIVQASRRFCTLLDIGTADHWLTAVLAEDRSATEHELQQAMRDAEPFSSRFRVACGDGAQRHVEMKAVPIRGPDGDAPDFVGMIEDVTEQVRAEAQRRQIDRDAAISHLTGGLAHNLNNMLMIIMGNLDTLKSSLADRPELRPTLDAGLAASDRAAALVSRLLVYSGHSTARFESLMVDQFLQGIAPELALRFGQTHQLNYVLDLPGTAVEFDAGMLKQAVEELVANAVAAMPAGGEIRISTRSAGQDAPTDQPGIVVAVTDRGIGMDADTLATAREPFFTMRDFGQNMGLGLSFVDGITRIAGGELKLKSDIGKGTTAEMHLPVAN